MGKIFNEKGIRYRIISKKRSDSYLKGGIYYSLYTHSCPAFSKLRREWYIENAKGRGIKRIPADIKLTSTALLHWYLGDGNFKRDNRNPPKGGRPCLRICTNGFLREDIELLLEKLRKDLGLNFYPLPKLNKNIKSGYVLHLYPADLFRFFKMIGLKPPREIENCITGIRNEKLYTFKGKWPNRIDLIRILAKTRGIGKLLKERRKELGLTQREVAEKIGIKKHHVSQIECGRKFLSLNCFNKFLQILKLKEDFMAIQIIKAIPEVLHL